MIGRNNYFAPLEIQYTTDTRGIWDNDVRDKIIYDKDDNPSGLFKDNKYAEIGFLSVLKRLFWRDDQL